MEYSVKEIANMMNLKRVSVNGVLRRAGIKPKYKGPVIGEKNPTSYYYDYDDLPARMKYAIDQYNGVDKDISEYQAPEIEQQPEYSGPEAEAPFFAAAYLTDAIIDQYVRLFGEDGARNILQTDYNLHPGYETEVQEES